MRQGIVSCPVAGCFETLQLEIRTWRCANGHCFDAAKSGYVNLLGPADKKAKKPGDAKGVVQARRRLMTMGLAGPLISEVIGILREAGIGADCAILDVGSGEGSILGQIREALGCRCIGLDLSVFAVDAAAKRFSHILWIAANGDRRLPISDSSVNAVLSIASRKNGPEFARILAPGGLAIVAVAGAGDLWELREAVHGKSIEKKRCERAVEMLGSPFLLLEKREVRNAVKLEGNGLKDLFSVAYRGVRRSCGGRIEALDAMTVTLAFDILVFKKIVGQPADSTARL